MLTAGAFHRPGHFTSDLVIFQVPECFDHLLSLIFRRGDLAKKGTKNVPTFRRDMTHTVRVLTCGTVP